MVAYNFQTRFVSLIESGDKTHTIRRNGRRRHARPGESLQLYTGQRTRNCRKILEPDPVCRFTAPILIDMTKPQLLILVGGLMIDDVDAFARCDGFRDASEMHHWWQRHHGPCTFEGTLIDWGGKER